jgi:hypothetical protein
MNHVHANRQPPRRKGGHDQADWKLNQGEGERSFVSPDISFGGHFGFPARLVLALAGVDADAQFNLRLRLTVHDVEAEEFNIGVHTWGDSIIYNVFVAWMAFDAEYSQ